MAAKKRTGKKRQFSRGPRRAAGASPSSPKTELKVRRTSNQNEWQLVYPRCADERTDDLEEVQQMIEGGETEIAVEELRWLLEGCRDLLPAHQMLGQIALEEDKLPLARGHFGYAYDIALAAMPPGGLQGILPHRVPENRPLLESAKGLAWCLHELEKKDMALDVVRQILRWDPSDPLGVRTWLIAWGSNQLPVL